MDSFTFLFKNPFLSPSLMVKFLFMKKSIIRNYDAAYKHLFDYPGMVRQLLENFIAMDWVKWVDYEKLEKINASFIRKNYKKKESDVIYKLNFQDQTAYLYLLLEFQSTVDPNMPFRIQSYVNDFYESIIKKEKKDRYPIIFPVVIYNGDKPWNVPDNIKDKIEVPKDPKLLPYIPSLKYFKVIINEFKKESLLKIRSILSSIFLIEQLDIKDFNTQLGQLAKIIKEELDPDIIEAFQNWFQRFIESEEIPDIQTLIHANEKEVNTMFAMTVEKWKKQLEKKGEKRGEKKGEKRGKIEGKIETAKNMLQKKYAIQTIAELTGLPLNEIKKLISKV